MKKRLKKSTAALLAAIITMCLIFSAPMSVYAAEATDNTAEPTGAVQLSSDTMSYTSMYDDFMTIPCEQLGGIYFFHEDKLTFYNTATGESSLVTALGNKGYYYSDAYLSGDKLYILEYTNSAKSLITVYNLISQSVEQTITVDGSMDAIGADDSGRIYLSDSDSENGGYIVYLFSPSGQLLSSAKSTERIYSFVGFDSTNGNFYVVGYANWVYWGYDHDMNALRAGNVQGDTITFNDTYIDLISQRYFYERQQPAELLGNKYIALDCTLYSRLELIDSNTCSVENSGANIVFNLSRNNSESGKFDSLASVGTRTVYRSDSDSIISFKDNRTLAEYNLSTGEEIASAPTAFPVFSLMKYKGGVAAIEKDGDNFYYEFFPWKSASYVEISGDASSMKVGETEKLAAATDGTLSQSYVWESNNPKIASVNQAGEVFAWSKGSADIIVTTKQGLKAAYTVTVTDDSSVINPKDSSVTTAGEESNNMSQNNYSVYGKTVKSYLVENSDATLSRVEYSGGKVIAETYSSDGKRLISSKVLDEELEIFGGFYSGADYNYIVYGQTNTEESDDKEVLRVVKYSKDWTRTASVPISGINTVIPFDAGSLRMTETDGKLYIHTCHEMYTSSDGLNHQANMTFVINEEDLTVAQSYYSVMNISQAGYVSHSFNQFIQTDGEYIYRVDHGDAYPRAISITKCDVSGDITKVSYTLPISLSNVLGYNATGASVGSFELSSDSCIVAGNAVDYETVDISPDAKRNIFVSVTGKNLKESNIVWLTQYDDDSDITVYTPQLVKIDKDQFMVMWEEYNSSTKETCTKMVTVDSAGNMTSDIIKSAMHLSDCRPILCSDGLVKWYVSNASAPVMYAVNPFDLYYAADNYLTGDANCDGKVNLLDAVTAQKVSLQITTLSEQGFLNADMNGDGKITVFDAISIQKKSLSV